MLPLAISSNVGVLLTLSLSVIQILNGLVYLHNRKIIHRGKASLHSNLALDQTLTHLLSCDHVFRY